ncbi:hypothetical protein BCR43DRAFT_506041 [Syncephalastrum racemosum]|uniref:Homeobox domain-containing protein n=1 Tax=Syncephalastrum racemosum TaxID=13706 RepID=A0A1X2HA83_SYNRA|nr:hypothetical protein BCR43DRAFT_506041 [Syncephalastrum racemosum]
MSSNDETESVDAWSPKIKKRWRFTPEDLTVLETSFMTESQHPKQRTVERLAMQLGSPRRTITTWFQNRRAKEKKKHAKKNELPASSAAASHIGQPLLEDQLWPVCTDPNCIYCSYFYYCYKYTNAQQ